MQNQIPKNWQKIKLGDLGKVVTGKTPPTSQKDYFEGKIPFITPSDITDFDVRYGYSTERFISEKWANKSRNLRIIKNTTCFVCIGSTIGKMCLAKQDSFTNQQINSVVVDELKSDSLFIYYLLKLKQRDIFKEFGGGAAKPIINKSTFEAIEVEVPKNVSEQRQIAYVLSTFDNKIEVNNKIAKTLEQMAQGLFKEWFVVHESTKWEVKKLGQILTLKHGFAFKSEQFTTNKTKNIVVRMGNFQQTGGLQFSDNTFYLNNTNGYEKYILKPGDMVMIFSDITREGRLIGNVGLIPNDENTYFLNQRVAKIAYDQSYKYFLLCLFNSRIFHQNCLARADSATVLNLKNEHVYEYKIADPDRDTLDKFNKTVTPIYRKIEFIKGENQKLAALRDLLLPKLMKGEIKI